MVLGARRHHTAGVLTAPPGATAQHGPRRLLVRRETSADDARRNADVDHYLGLAYATGVAADMRIGHSKLVRLVRAFVATKATGDEFVGWLTTYADPTGDTAVWNVLKSSKPG